MNFFLNLMMLETLLRGFVSEPFGVLIFAFVLIGSAVGLRWFFKWNEEAAQNARNLSQELLEKTIG